MVLGSQNMLTKVMDLKLEYKIHEIEKVEYLRYLGIIIDNKLKFDNYAE